MQIVAENVKMSTTIPEVYTIYEIKTITLMQKWQLEIYLMRRVRGIDEKAYMLSTSNLAFTCLHRYNLQMTALDPNRNIMGCFLKFARA